MTITVERLVAIRDQRGEVQPRGKILNLGKGRRVFYRDVDRLNLIRVINGYAIEEGVLNYLRAEDVERIHYEERQGPLYATSVTSFALHGAPWAKNGREQLVLPLAHWDTYPRERAYHPPVVDMPWTVVDHASGKVITSHTRGMGTC